MDGEIRISVAEIRSVLEVKKQKGRGKQVRGKEEESKTRNNSALG